jgi:hypothetical protein
LWASLTFWYSYDREEKKLTIRGNGDKTKEQLLISTFLNPDACEIEGLDTPLIHHHAPNDVGQNHPHLNLWSDYVNSNTEFANLITAIARRCNDTIVQSSINAGLSSVLCLGAAPLVTFDNVDDIKLMFGKSISDAVPSDQLDEIMEAQQLINSTYVGIVTWAPDQVFANVIGSASDPKPGGARSWIGLWMDHCNDGVRPSYCSSHNWFSADPAKQCSYAMVGGHVITGTTAKLLPVGSTVYIFPLCSNHNGYFSGHMRHIYNPIGIQLKYF